MTIAEALKQATARLATEPLVCESALRDAELLLMHVLHASRATLIAYPDRGLTSAQQAKYVAMIEQRLATVPIQYITGEQEFWGLRFRVTPDVLIPRPETEHLVEALLCRVPHDQAITIVDIGTGSGAIAVALAHSLPLAHIAALDISPAALRIAQENAVSNDVASRIEFLESDLLTAVAGRQFDAIVSNPPYIALEERNTLHPQVSEHEPALALFSGNSGYEIYERLIPQAWDALKPGGWLLMEIGQGQQERISTLLHGWKSVEFVADLQGIPRVAVASHP
ncbi:MAG: peptide chain release factor N(5)-glutamine methyltransferase [Acidobacteriaceae bacterium]